MVHEDPANGLRCVAALGCLPAVKRSGFALRRQRMWSGAGKLLADVPRVDDDPLYRVTLMRADLVSILRAEAIRLGATNWLHTYDPGPLPPTMAMVSWPA